MEADRGSEDVIEYKKEETERKKLHMQMQIKIGTPGTVSQWESEFNRLRLVFKLSGFNLRLSVLLFFSDTIHAHAQACAHMLAHIHTCTHKYTLEWH